MWTDQALTLAVSSAFTLLPFTRTILNGLDTSHTLVCTCCRGTVRTEGDLTWVSSIRIIYCENMYSHTLLLHSHSLPARTQNKNNVGGQAGHWDVKPSWFARVSRKNSITWHLESMNMTNLQTSCCLLPLSLCVDVLMCLNVTVRVVVCGTCLLVR